jgi:hypothetical protein
MKGDFTRNTFDPTKHFTRVLMQQGRVQLDADLNEQTAILLHYLQNLTRDLIGPHGGPLDQCGFRIVAPPEELDEEEKRQAGDLKLHSDLPDFFIGSGRYYVDGRLCENETIATYQYQPDYPAPQLLERAGLVYLDVWERHLSFIEDGAIREVALGGPDTATRAKLVWQVKVWPLNAANCAAVQDQWEELLEIWQPAHRGRLIAQAKKPEGAELTDPCITPPRARYRGAENQLYRVEIHQGGSKDQARFKWSRDNGSVVFPIRTMNGSLVVLEHLGRDNRLGLVVGDLVEVVDNEYALGEAEARPLVRVDKVDPVELTVTLSLPNNLALELPYIENDPRRPLLRRWDHREGTLSLGGLKLTDDKVLPVIEGDWITLEDGVQVYFQPPETGQHHYRTGDYWLIPARTATGDVEWSLKTDREGNPIKDNKGIVQPLALPPHGVEHHYAPLALIAVEGKSVTWIEDCRCRFNRLACPDNNE